MIERLIGNVHRDNKQWPYVVQRWVLVKVRLRLGITVLVCPRLSDSGDVAKTMSRELPGRGHLGIFLGGYVPPGTPNWHPVLEMGQFFIPRSRIRPKTDTPF